MNSNNPLTEPEVESTLAKVEREALEAPKVATTHTRGKGLRPPKEGETWRVSEQDKQLLVSLWASGNTFSEVYEKAHEEYNINVSREQIMAYTKSLKWQKLIEKIKKETYSDIASVAGSHKKVRLSRAEKIYEKSMSKNKFKDALAATEHQRKEMEGGGDFNVTLNQYNVLSDEELEFKKKEVLDRIARMNNKGVIDVIATNKDEAASPERLETPGV